MKKVYLMLLFISLLILGCSNSNNDISKDDLFVIDHYSNEKIGIGMEKADVEEILGPFTHDETGKFHVYNDGIWIAYRDEKVAGIVLEEGSEERFSTTRNLRVSSTRNEVIETYGDFISDEDLDRNSYMMFDILNLDGEFHVAPISDENREHGYIFSIHTGRDIETLDEVILISIIDYMYSVYMK